MTPIDPTNRTLRLTRRIAIALIVIILSTHTVSVMVWAKTLQQACFESVTVCQQSRSWLMPEAAAALQAAGISLTTYAILEVFKIVFFSSIWMGVGGLILLRRPNEWIALVVAFTLITFPTLWDGIGNILILVYPFMQWPIYIMQFLINLGLPLFLALFPNGRWVPRWARWVVLIMVLSTTFQAFTPERQQYEVESFQEVALGISFLLFLFVGQVIRYWRFSTPVERLQARWVVSGIGAAFAIVIAMLIVSQLNILPNPGPLSGFANEMMYQMAVSLIPISVAIAILRYHLFDIDILIRRTLQYTLLTGLLALTYFGSIVLIQNLFFGDQTSEIAIVISTLAIAALFNPLRHRVQDSIDRRFYRKKYNAEQALARFAAVARDEVDMDKLAAALIGVVEETVQPERVSLWLRNSDAKPQRREVSKE